jgi:hypothetical protein
MQKFDDRTTANLDVVLEDVCRGLPNNGGDHETRKFIARRLIWAARHGDKTLGGLNMVARRALQRFLRGRAA